MRLSSGRSCGTQSSLTTQVETAQVTRLQKLPRRAWAWARRRESQLPVVGISGARSASPTTLTHAHVPPTPSPLTSHSLFQFLSKRTKSPSTRPHYGSYFGRSHADLCDSVASTAGLQLGLRCTSNFLQGYTAGFRHSVSGKQMIALRCASCAHTHTHTSAFS